MSRAPFRLVPGVPGPRQQGPTTCGAACATVARMLVDPPFARWITAGEGQPVPGADGQSQAERFASWERTVQDRTNGWRSPNGGLLLPWPKQLGTPPWGLRHELEHGASRAGTRYRIVVVRGHSRAALRDRYRRLVDLVVEGEPAVLYVGHRLLPRHVTLVVPGDGGGLSVYEPQTGSTGPLGQADFASGRLGLGGWDTPWILIQPTGHRRARSLSPARARWRVPGLSPDPSPDFLRHRRHGSTTSTTSSRA